MTVKEIIEKLDLKCLNQVNLDAEVEGAYASDLLSDVMGNARSGQVWITMQTHKNVTAIASLKDMPAVIIVRDGTPDPDMFQHAQDEEICLLVSKDNTFELCGKLYDLLK